MKKMKVLKFDIFLMVWNGCMSLCGIHFDEEIICCLQNILVYCVRFSLLMIRNGLFGIVILMSLNLKVLDVLACSVWNGGNDRQNYVLKTLSDFGYYCLDKTFLLEFYVFSPFLFLLILFFLIDLTFNINLAV